MLPLAESKFVLHVDAPLYGIQMGLLLPALYGEKVGDFRLHEFPDQVRG